MLFLQQQSDSLYILCHVAVAGGGFFTQAGWGSALSNLAALRTLTLDFLMVLPAVLNWCAFLQAGAREREDFTHYRIYVGHQKT